jgi:hypothetical protein
MSQIRWLPSARRLIGLRDRFTQDEILKDFKAKLEGFGVPPRDDDPNAIEVDQGVWATPVAENRYIVLWSRDPQDSDAVNIRAVLATQLRKSEDQAVMRQKLERVALVESNGALKLF